jgi:spermidine synthase
MLRAFIRLLMLVGLTSCIVLVVLPLASRFRSGGLDMPVAARLKSGGFLSTGFLLEAALLVCGAALAILALHYLLKKLALVLDADASAQARFLDNLDLKYVDAAIVSAAALSLFLELALIRWQSSVLVFLAFYKNFSLLACFAGLGLGYALATRNRIPLLTVLPLLAWQFGFIMLTGLVPSLFYAVPFREQFTMGMGTGDWPRAVILYVLLTMIFLITALTFLPIGQLCGRLMERRANLRAYGLNLLGSLLGVVLMLLASLLWTPPLVWFAVCFLGILLFHSRQRFALTTGVVFTLVCTAVLAWWPIDRLWNRVYSPYQVLEIGADPDTGLTLIRAAGHYYQRIYDFSNPNLSPSLTRVRNYYDFPYRAQPVVDDVAVVGAGTGNDVAASLRAGAGRVDAIEIDPAILATGKLNHPEKPYDSLRVRAVTNDARSFLRGTDRKYDLVVYGLLDSHTLLSHGSSVRLDSFVYTVEGLRDARNRLKPGGMVSLSFSVISDALGRKIYLMLQQVFDGQPPVCVSAGYDGAVIFLASNEKNWLLPPKLLQDTGFTDRTARYADPSLQANVSTDDWPFFYMPRRLYPVSYLIMIFQILALSLLVGAAFFDQSPKFSHLSFFFLGVGFMLIETKGITEMGLTFGNTWQVIGVVIAGILTMAFLGNCLVRWLGIKRALVPYLFLWAALAIGWLAARSGGFASTPLGRLETALLLTLPLLFSGIVFSTLLSTTKQISGIMAMNLLGAICGGLLEYNSMYFGFRALYVMAMACYMLAFASQFAFRKREPANSVQAAIRRTEVADVGSHLSLPVISHKG